jgi:RNA polymerase sigma factor (sigma-70 family)
MANQEDKPAGTSELVPLVYHELCELARHYFRRQRPGFTLRPTDLVNEACLHLIQHAPGPWDSPEHFRAIAARKIWQVIVDHLKRRNADKRGGGRRPRHVADPDTATGDSADTGRTADTWRAEHRLEPSHWQRVELDSIQIEWPNRQIELLDLAEALDDLGRQHARLNEIVMLHWFAGLKYADVARLLGVSASTVEKDFRFALAWLSRRLEAGADE